jgi:glycine cleavage system H protein
VTATPTELKFTKTHQWARQLPDGSVEIGITEYAEESLGDLVSVEMPNLGQHVAAGEALAEVESLKTTSDVSSPVAGDVVATNAQLANTPELVNQDPYGKGWIARLHPADAGWQTALLSASAYDKLVETERKSS